MTTLQEFQQPSNTRPAGCPAFEALLDSDVVVAILAEAHEHHTASLALLAGPVRARFAIPAGSLAP